MTRTELAGPCIAWPDGAQSLRQQLAECDRLLASLARQGGTSESRRQRAQAHNNRGIIHLGLGRDEAGSRPRAVQPRLLAARDDFTAAIALERNLVAAFVNRGVVHCRLAAAAPALADFEWALALYPASAEALFDRAICREQLGQLPEALADATAAVKAAPDDAAMQALLKRIADKAGRTDLGLEAAYNLRLLGAADTLQIEPRLVPSFSHTRVQNRRIMTRAGKQHVQSSVQQHRHDARCPPGVAWDAAAGRCGAGAVATPDETPTVKLFVASNRTPVAPPPAAGGAPFSATPDTRLHFGIVTVALPKSAREIGALKPNKRWWERVAEWLPFTGGAEDQFRLSGFDALDEARFFAAVAERIARHAERDGDRALRFTGNAFLFVHGCCNTFEAAAFRAAQIVADIRFNGAPFLFSWPTLGDPQHYTTDVASVGQAAVRLRELLDKVLARPELTKVHLIAHSRGAHVLLQALKEKRLLGTAGLDRVGEIILAAPDVPVGDFQDLAEYLTAIGRSRTLYVNDSDRALQLSKQFWGDRHTPVGIRQANGRPLFVRGVYSVDVTDVSSDVFWSTRHAYWAENALILNDISLLMLSGLQPPDTRMPIIRPVTSGDEVYYPWPK